MTIKSKLTLIIFTLFTFCLQTSQANQIDEFRQAIGDPTYPIERQIQMLDMALNQHPEFTQEQVNRVEAKRAILVKQLAVAQIKWNKLMSKDNNPPVQQGSDKTKK